MKICPKCKTENQDKELYCATCMTSLEEVKATYTEEQKKQKQAEEYNQKKLEISEKRSKAFRKVLVLFIVLCIVGVLGATTFFVLKHIGRQRELDAQRHKEQTELKIAENKRLEAEAANAAIKLAIEKEKAEKERLELEAEAANAAIKLAIEKEKAEKERLEAERKAANDALARKLAEEKAEAERKLAEEKAEAERKLAEEKAKEARRLAEEKAEAAKQLALQKKIEEIKKSPAPKFFKAKNAEISNSYQKYANAVAAFYKTKGASYTFENDLRKSKGFQGGLLLTYKFPTQVVFHDVAYSTSYAYKVKVVETLASGEMRTVIFELTSSETPKIRYIEIDGRRFDLDKTL